ncbi:Zinc finger and BTB [Mactra antiquata]
MNVPTDENANSKVTLRLTEPYSKNFPSNITTFEEYKIDRGTEEPVNGLKHDIWSAETKQDPTKLTSKGYAYSEHVNVEDGYDNNVSAVTVDNADRTEQDLTKLTSKGYAYLEGVSVEHDHDNVAGYGSETDHHADVAAQSDEDEPPAYNYVFDQQPYENEDVQSSFNEDKTDIEGCIDNDKALSNITSETTEYGTETALLVFALKHIKQEPIDAIDNGAGEVAQSVNYFNNVNDEVNVKKENEFETDYANADNLPFDNGDKFENGAKLDNEVTANSKPVDKNIDNLHAENHVSDDYNGIDIKKETDLEEIEVTIDDQQHDKNADADFNDIGHNKTRIKQEPPDVEDTEASDDRSDASEDENDGDINDDYNDDVDDDYDCDDDKSAVFHKEEKTKVKKRKGRKQSNLTWEERLFCQICNKKFSHPSNRLAHEKMIHLKIKPRKCTVCGKGFYSSANLKKHMNSHTGNRPYTCTICNKGFTQPGNMKRHMKSHDLIPSYECPTCHRAFKEKGNMKRHLETHTDLKKYLCKACSRRFRTSSNLQRHIESIHKKSRNYFCQICKKSFSCADSIRLHMKIHLDERNHLCSKCGKRFIVKTALKRHLEMHRRQDALKYSCGICNRAYSNVENLTAHMVLHTEGNAHICHVCNKSFSNSVILKEHMLTHPKDKPFVCQTCNKAFNSAHVLRRHCSIHGAQKPYSCDICGKSFLYSWYLKTHMHVHSGERPHICSLCDKCFAYKPSLKAHMRIHAGQKNYMCEICNKGFIESASLKRHYKSKIHQRRMLKATFKLEIDVDVETVSTDLVVMKQENETASNQQSTLIQNTETIATEQVSVKQEDMNISQDIERANVKKGKRSRTRSTKCIPVKKKTNTNSATTLNEDVKTCRRSNRNKTNKI